MSNKLWVNGICDNIVYTLEYWIRNYEKGTVSATCRYMTKPGELGPAPQEIDKPTRKALEMPWRKIDLEKFISILDQVIPHNHTSYALVRDLRTSLPRWKNGKLYPTVPGSRLITLDWYFKDIVQVYRIFGNLKRGLPVTPQEIQDLASIDLEKVWQK